MASGINFFTSLVSFAGFYTEYEPNFVSCSTFKLLIILKVEPETKLCSLVLAKLLYHNDLARKGQ